MGYVKKELQELMHITDRVRLPANWDEFVNKEKVKHNLIIKNKDIYICTNCHNEFINSKSVKVNELLKCPKCKNKYIVKSKKLKKYKFDKDLLLLSKVKDKFVIRMFKLDSYFENESNKFKHYISEYARIVGDTLLYNNRIFINTGGYVSIRHYRNIEKWRTYDGYYKQYGAGKVYPYNLNNILYNSELKYCDMSTLANKVECINLEAILIHESYSQTLELLIKLKLYNLIENISEFNITGSFIQRFGVGKEYLKFMQKNNINSKELKILSIYKKQNIKVIRLLSIYNISELEILNKYMDLKKILKYKLNPYDLRLYIDYIKFLEKLGYDIKNKKYLFPKNIKEAHDSLEKQVKLKDEEKLNKSILKRYSKLKNNIFESKKYIILPVKSLEILKDESKQQNNCVRTYAEDYANGECDIYTMRLVTEQDKSLVTVEVKDNKIVQAKIKNNGKPTDEQFNFLNKWKNNILRKKELENGRNVKKYVI